MTTIRLSSKGQIVIPKPVREAHGWEPGQEFVVEEQNGSVLLRPQPLFPATSVDEVFGCLAYEGPPVSIEDMNRAVERAARARWHNEGAEGEARS